MNDSGGGSHSGLTVTGSNVGRPTGGVDTGHTHHVQVQRRLVPIIFVPGIMGSRLEHGDGPGAGEKKWDPDSKGFMFNNFVSLTQAYPKKKKDLLIGGTYHRDGYLRPALNDAEHNKKVGLSPLEIARGWGGVFWGSYGSYLRTLAAATGGAGAAVGNIAGRPAVLTEMPVFAYPYNWTGSCAVAGASLAQRIPAIIDQAKREIGAPGIECPGVIVVTHSMGGLVARAACRLSNAEGRVLGVVHGVQPAVGAAAAYWRMKAGFPRSGIADVQAMALGKDGPEVVALLANMPGGLELLPSAEYRGANGEAAWLNWPMTDGTTKHLPTGGDPYTEIYQQFGVEWGLVPDAAWLAPTRDGTVVRSPLPAPLPSAVGRFGVPKIGGASAVSPVWVEYVNRVARASAFHQHIARYQHPRSYHFWGIGGASTPATVSFTSMQLRPATLDDPNYTVLYGAIPRADADSSDEAVVNWRSQQACNVLNMQAFNSGEYQFWQPIARNGQTDYELGLHGKVWNCVLRPGTDSGDGTVPAGSGGALAHGHPAANVSAFVGIDHEGAYRVAGTQAFVMRALRALTASAAPAKR